MKNKLISPLSKVLSMLRKPSGHFDAEFYANYYKDLSSIAEHQLHSHWLNSGKSEGRHGCFESLLKSSRLKSENIPKDFDADFYIESYVDLQTANIDNYYAAAIHYLTNGHKENRAFSSGIDKNIDVDFYQEYYSDLAHFSANELAEHWNNHGSVEGRYPNLSNYLVSNKIKINPNKVKGIDFKTLQLLNPGLLFKNASECFLRVFTQRPITNIKLFADNELNSRFYFDLYVAHLPPLKLIQKNSKNNDNKKKKKKNNPIVNLQINPLPLLTISLVYNPNNTDVLEVLGNNAFHEKKYNVAIDYYSRAIANSTASTQVSIHLIKSHLKLNQIQHAIDVIKQHSAHQDLRHETLKCIHKTLDRYWAQEEQKFFYYASTESREELLKKIQAVVNEISNCYRGFYHAYSSQVPKQRLNKSRVLIVGDQFLPQCKRYRIDQKVEQFETAGIQATSVSWTEYKKALHEIATHDYIIFYRVPALKNCVHLIEYAKSLGKITFYEIDDLVFDPVYPDEFSTYGNSIDTQTYVNLIKGMCYFRCAAQLCDYGIVSTLPLQKELESVVIKKKCFVHRNGLDHFSQFQIEKTANQNQAFTLFYGTGTKAHNADFIQLAVPAIDQILSENLNCCFVYVGYLNLPDAFLNKFNERITYKPFVKDIGAYLYYLSAADINLAVLENNRINHCKSELKWFEAGALSIPSVVSATQNYTDVCDDQNNVVFANNTEEFYLGIKKLMDDDAFRIKISRNAYQAAIQGYSLEPLSQNLVNLLADSERHFLSN